jgi:hypothetical protein
MPNLRLTRCSATVPILATGLTAFFFAACQETIAPSRPPNVTASATTATGCVAAPAGIIAWWSGDGDAKDLVGGHDGTLINGATFASGKVGQAFSFDGNSRQYVEVPDDPAWTFGGSNAFTIELWAYLNVFTAGEPYVGYDEGPGETNKWIFWDETGFEFHINSPSLGPRYPAIGGFSPTPGQWYHFAVTRSGDTWTLYVNGGAVMSNTVSIEIPDANAPLTIGRAEEYFLNGLLDEVTIYNRALSAPEISAIAAAGEAGKCRSNSYPFGGFFEPVNNPPTVNVAKAGSAIPVKFSLGGDRGLSILAENSPGSQAISCVTGAPSDEIETTVSAGSSSLTYDAATGQYVYVWKTEKAWASTCRRLDVTLTDGTIHSASFQFKR